ncbi:uncharacterized protein LOC130569819 [Triplophysa rosa]|nr:uncharacterized protein LOC130569819 [Triplophysa rosa]
MGFKQFRYIRRVGGSSRYCCVPLCRASQRFNSVLSFHAFPTNKENRMKWLRNIRRAIANITPEFRVCGRHFESDDFTKSFTKAGRRIIRKGAVPTLFQWNNYTGGDVPSSVDNDSGHMTLQQLEHNYCLVFKPVPTDLALKQKEAPCKVEELSVDEHLCLGRFAASDDDIRHYTRFLSYKHLMAFWRLIEPETNKIRVTRVLPSVVRGPSNETSRSLQRIDEFFLFMVYLSVGLSLSDLAHRFNIHQYMVIKIIRAWASFLHSILGSVHIWMSEEAVKAHLPKEFQDYPDTQVVIDCAELRCEVPSGLPIKSEECSSYKAYCTFKGLIGMAPHGAVTYVSSLYAGSISDKELLKRSGLFSLLKPGMAIMVDKGFPVDESVPCKVYSPFCFLKRENMSADEVRESESVSSLRVHVESRIHRVKQHKLFDTVISSSITANINQLYTVACLLVNYQNGPLVKVEAKD